MVFLKENGGSVMADKKLYVVNSGSTALATFVRPQSGEGLKVFVGPRSFVTVSTQAVSGALPWTVMGSAITALPAIAIAAYAPNRLTAVAYPMS
jgi:hypothetical protein